jgi:hypothetical protein
MASGSPAPEVIIVHGRQVIVHQRIHVHELDGAGRRLDLLFGQSDGTGSGEQQRRAHPFTATQDAVAHGLV